LASSLETSTVLAFFVGTMLNVMVKKKKQKDGGKGGTKKKKCSGLCERREKGATGEGR
jgi:hypothetical protein